MNKTAKAPYLFDEFFASGKEESISPFLTRESRKWSRNLSLKVSLISALCLCLAFVLHFLSMPLSRLFLLFVYVLSGTPALIQALKDLKNLEINIDVLMTLAAILSVVIGSGLEGALLLVLFELSASMEQSVTQKTKSTLAALHKLSPNKAFLIAEDGHLFEKSVKEITVGTRIFIKAGEIAPLDGLVVEGSSFIMLSHLTGESTPIAKKIGDEVPAGAKNLDGSLVLQVTCRDQDSTLSRIIELITQAQESKPKLQKWIDHFDKKYATTIIALTFFFALFLPFFVPDLPYLGLEGSVYRALTFLIAASPCALILATPTAYLSAISSCAKKGILLKGGAILDALATCKSVAFDKTGTLTTGALRCIEILPLNEEAKKHPIDEIIATAASLEKHVKHPIGEAIQALAQEKKLTLPNLERVKSIPGSGITGDLPTLACFLGSASFVLSKLSKPLPLSTETSSTQTYLLVGEALFLFRFKDEVRSDAKKLLARLQNDLKMHVMMLTGDEEKNALPIGRELGIQEIFAHLTPEDKLDKVALFSQKKGLIMIGDGVNDAPALARATVGISMGKIGSASAVSASDVVFLQDDLSSLDFLIKKSHKTLSIIKQNLSLALVVILFATTPALLGFIPLWLAVVLHEGGTLLVGLNSLRLLKK